MVFTSLLLIGIILLQASKTGGMGTAMGQTAMSAAFGGHGGDKLMVRATSGLAFLSVKRDHRFEIVNLAKKLLGLNFKLCATKGTARTLERNGIKCKKINKVTEGSPHIVNILNAKKNRFSD